MRKQCKCVLSVTTPTPKVELTSKGFRGAFVAEARGRGGTDSCSQNYNERLRVRNGHSDLGMPVDCLLA